MLESIEHLPAKAIPEHTVAMLYEARQHQKILRETFLANIHRWCIASELYPAGSCFVNQHLPQCAA